jgi:hypothetical protein
MAETTQNLVRAQVYSEVILPLARQQKSMLHDTVYVKSGITGKSFFQDQIGTWSMTKKTTANPATPQNDPGLSRRRVDMETYHDARIMDRSLLLQELSDPMSVSSICVQSSVGKQIDSIIYTSMGATAKQGETGETSVTFPSSQEIAANDTGLTIAKLRRAMAKLDDAGVPSEDRYFVGGAVAKEQLLSTTEATSQDYNTVKALVAGDIDTFLGFNFKWLPGGIISKDGNIATCYAYHKTGICYGMVEELALKMDERPDLSYSKQIYYEFTAGATRLEEEKVVKILIDESK